MLMDLGKLGEINLGAKLEDWGEVLNKGGSSAIS